MTQHLDVLQGMIARNVESLVSTVTFQEWYGKEAAKDGDLILLNNSYIYRSKVSTVKNSQYLCLKVAGSELDVTSIYVARPGDFNSDFKRFSASSKNLPVQEPLELALGAEMCRLGQLAFVFIGELSERPIQAKIESEHLKELCFIPFADCAVAVEEIDGGGQRVIINKLADPEASWAAVCPILDKKLVGDLSKLETAFANAFERVREEARLSLALPVPGTCRRGDTLLSRWRASIAEQRKQYDSSSCEYMIGGTNEDTHLRDAMRIAYNFSEDALRVLRLLVSIADLKGLLLWSTIGEHFAIAEAFRNLWVRSNRKPSLEGYQKIIAGARNRAFHNLLALDRTVEADLQGVQVGARRLTLFPPYSRSRVRAHFDYEDREMVEIVAELTRAPEVAVPLDFWKKNSVVMECFERLLLAAEDALWAANAARSQLCVAP